MKIVFAIWAGEDNCNNPFFYTTVSGDVLAAKKLAVALAKDGNDIIFFSLGKEDRNEVKEGVNVVTVHNPYQVEKKVWNQETISKYLPLYLDLYVNALSELCRKKNVELILPRPLYPASVASYIVSKSCGVPVLPTSAGFDYLFFFEQTRGKYNCCFTNSFQCCLQEKGGYFSKKFSDFVDQQRRLLKEMLKKSQGVIFIAPHMISHAEEVVKEHAPFYMVPDGLDLSMFPFDRKGRENLYNEYTIEKKIVITCVARLDEDKRQDLLIEAMPELIKMYPCISLVLAGDGNRRDRLESMVKNMGIDDYILFLGALPNEKVPLLLSTSHLALYPTEGEGLPLFLLEAMASGLPIVVSKVDPFNYMVGEDIGFLAENTPSSWTEQITLALLDIDSLIRKGESSAKKAKVYDIKAVCDRFFKIINTHNLCI